MDVECGCMQACNEMYYFRRVVGRSEENRFGGYVRIYLVNFVKKSN